MIRGHMCIIYTLCEIHFRENIHLNSQDLMQTTPRYLAVFQCLFELFAFNGISGTFQCCFHFFVRHLVFIGVQQRHI